DSGAEDDCGSGLIMAGLLSLQGAVRIPGDAPDLDRAIVQAGPAQHIVFRGAELGGDFPRQLDDKLAVLLANQDGFGEFHADLTPGTRNTASVPPAPAGRGESAALAGSPLH